MINLNALRNLIGLAVKDNKESFTITVVEAQQFVIEAEKMHDGNCELSNYRAQIANLTKKVKTLTEQLIDTKRKLAMKPEDKVSSILEDGL